jgi:hypothetical protein
MRNLSAREPGDPGGAHRLEKAAGRKGNPQGHALHARHREVGPPPTTGEGSEQTPQGERRDWREGGGSRRTRWRNTRTGHRNGMPCHRDYRAFVWQSEGTKDYSSQRPSVKSTRDCCWTASIRQPRALHPYPLERFYANIRDKSRVPSQRLHGSVRGAPRTGIPTATGRLLIGLLGMKCNLRGGRLPIGRRIPSCPTTNFCILRYKNASGLPSPASFIGRPMLLTYSLL